MDLNFLDKLHLKNKAGMTLKIPFSGDISKEFLSQYNSP